MLSPNAKALIEGKIPEEEAKNLHICKSVHGLMTFGTDSYSLDRALYEKLAGKVSDISMDDTHRHESKQPEGDEALLIRAVQYGDEDQAASHACSEAATILEMREKHKSSAPVAIHVWTWESGHAQHEFALDNRPYLSKLKKYVRKVYAIPPLGYKQATPIETRTTSEHVKPGTPKHLLQDGKLIVHSLEWTESVESKPSWLLICVPNETWQPIAARNVDRNYDVVDMSEFVECIFFFWIVTR